MKTYFAPILLFTLFAANFYLIFVVAPEELTQGLVQKIFYFHVSSALAMYAGFLAAGFSALIYLLTRRAMWDSLSKATAEVGFVFCTMVLVSGPIWAKPIWGTWWTWDPRLTTTLFIWFLFLSIFLLRRFFGADPRGRLVASVLTLFALADLPFIFLAVKLWRGIHPSVLGQEGNMPGEMKLALIFTNITVLIFSGYLAKNRYRLLRLEHMLMEEV